MATILTIETPTLGDRSYLVHDGETAFVVDPQRDIDRVLDLAEECGVRIAAVFETHIHNDYVTGGLALAEATGAIYYVNGADVVEFDRVPVADGDVVDVGTMRVRVMATPGHTFTHLSYALEGDPGAVFTGGSLLFGSTGRPDLLGQEHAETLARQQFSSAHRLAGELGDETEVMPTHGFGSFCSATQTSGDASTIGQEKRQNPVLTKDEAAYVEEVLAGLEAHPAYYVRMGPANAAGPGAADLEPVSEADAAELRRRLEAGEWLVDLRTRTAFAAGHVHGSVNFGVDGELATYLGWLLPWGTPITLLGESQEQVQLAQRELARIGIDRPAASATGDPTGWTTGELASFPSATFADLAAVLRHRQISVLDVRRPSEHAAARVAGAVNIPIHEILDRAAELPGGEVWVHCQGGYRASIVASFLASWGRDVVAVDDSFDEAADAGVPLERD